MAETIFVKPLEWEEIQVLSYLAAMYSERDGARNFSPHEITAHLRFGTEEEIRRILDELRLRDLVARSDAESWWATYLGFREYLSEAQP